MTGSGSTVLSLACALADVQTRVDAANRLADHLGADSLLAFVRDVDLKLLVAAQGFSSTIPGDPVWTTFLDASSRPGVHRGEVLHGVPARMVPATAYTDDAGTVLVFVGATLTIHPDDFAMPLLCALFRAEQRAWAARGQAAAAAEAARHANALATALDRSRSELEGAIQAKQQSLKDRQMLLGIVGHDLRNPLNTIS